MDKTEKEYQEIIDKLKEDLYNYEIFFDNSEEAFFIHIDGVPIVMNNAALKLIGIKREELANFLLYDFIAEEDLEMVKNKIRSGFEGVYEFRIKRKNGEKIPCRFYVKKILYRDKIARVVFVRDISDEIKKLQEQEKQIKDIEKYRKVLVAMAKAISKIEISYERTIEIIIEMAHFAINSCCCGFWMLEDNNKYLQPIILITEDLNKEDYRIDLHNLNKDFIENRINIIESIEIREKIFPKSKCKEKILLMSPVKYEENFIGVIIFFRNSPWLQYEQDFIASVSDMVMLAFEKWNRKWAEEELQTTLKE
ncbi:MAG: PAS domain S-box protein, partial [Candidatus Goldbacteria bacterium]|nr:PAS domain S-box protein [Candidatus Goldiibacteriota bacterium]